MRKLGIGYYLNAAGTDMQYGSSDGSNAYTAVTSTTVTSNYGYPADPSLLIEGSIGIYGDAKDGTGLYLLYGSSVLSNFTSFMIYQGGKSEIILLAQFLGAELQTINSIAYLKPLKQVISLGYTTLNTGGSLNTGTVVVGDSGQIQLNQRMVSANPISSYFSIGDTGKLAASATGYAVLAPTLAQLNNNRGTNSPLKKGTWFITGNGTLTTVQANSVLKFTKGSKTVSVLKGGNTAMAAYSITTPTLGAILSIGTQYYQRISFDITYASSKYHNTIIGGTEYVVTDVTDDATTATAIAAAINAGTQAYATVSSNTVTITLLPSVYSAKIIMWKGSGTTASGWATETINTGTTSSTIITTGDTIPMYYKVASASATASSFDLDYVFEGETCYVISGTDATLNVGTTSPTEYGAKFIASNYFEEFTVQVNGVLANASLNYSIAPTSGSGEFSEERLLEMYGRYYRGAVDTYSAVAKTPVTFYTKEGKGYDNYSIVIKPLRSDGSGLNATSSNEYNLDMGFEHFNLTASTGDNQYVWEAVLDLFVTAYPNLAYTSLV